MDQILPPDWIQWLTIFNTVMSVTVLIFTVISGLHRFLVKPRLDIELRVNSQLTNIGSFKILNATVSNSRTWRFGKTATHCEGRLILDRGREHPLCWVDYGDKQVIDITPNSSGTLELIRIVVEIDRPPLDTLRNVRIGDAPKHRNLRRSRESA